MATVLDLSALTSQQGYQITGAEAEDWAGWSVASAGDVNGDGLADVIVGGIYNDLGGESAGAAFVVFGQTGTPGPIDLSALSSGSTSSLGFGVFGVTHWDQAGYSVSGAGDVNGDGYDDLIVGVVGGDSAPYNDSGKAYVIFGHAGEFAPLALSTLIPGDGIGFMISGAAANDMAGSSVAAAGDVNGDGFADLMIGAESNDAGGMDAGAAYVIYGHDGAYADLSLATLSPSSAEGFKIQGDTGDDRTGFSLSRAGDINGDGHEDLIIAAPYSDTTGTRAGAVYVVYGQENGFDSIDLTDVTSGAVAGFVAYGPNDWAFAGYDVAGGGDFNGDGYDDVLIGAFGASGGGSYAGAAYLIYGSATGPGNLTLTSLAGGSAAGFMVQGNNAGDEAGASVAFAGDLNGDGLDDIVIGAPAADNGGANAGEAYVIWGRADNPGTIDLTTFDDTLGFVIQGDAAGDRTGASLGAAGDVNGDGADDLIIGAYSSALGGNYAGAAWVIYGTPATPQPIDGTADDDLLTGTAEGDTINGLAGDDTLIGLAGADTLNGGDGVDSADYSASVSGVTVNLAFTGSGGDAEGDVLSGIENLIGSAHQDGLVGDGAANHLIGGDGNDQLNGGGGNDSLDGGTGDDNLVGNAGADTLAGGDGIDWAVYGESPRAVTVNLTTGLGSGGDAAGDVLSGIDNLWGSDLGDRLTGAAGANELRGDNGNDTLAGRAGADTLAGGNGTDWADYSASASGVTVSLATGKGSGGEAAGDVLSGVEALTGSAKADRLTGNAAANSLKGGGGNDRLAGGAGADRLEGGTGDDTMTGGAGRDALLGGTGRDDFVFLALGDSGTAKTARDVITGFTHLIDDINLSAIDARTGAGNQAFSFIGKAAFHHVKGELHFRHSGGLSLVEGDTNGDGRADFAIQINGIVTLTAADFIL